MNAGAPVPNPTGILTRDLSQMAREEYDLIIVGGGIFGVCAAWDAVSRGLTVALLEKKDFAHGTSANSLKMIHGGIRYLQHGDLSRLRGAVKERRSFLRIAPHLTHPLPIAIPIYGHGLKGKEILWAGASLYDLLAFDRNRGIGDPERRIPKGRLISRRETITLFPDLDRHGLTGAAIVYDGQMYNATRLALSFLRSAVSKGAVAANYLEVTAFLKTKAQITGIRATDAFSGREVEVHGRFVLNASGPWAKELLEGDLDIYLNPKVTYSRDVCFILPRRVTGDYGVAVQARTRDPDAILSGRNRHLFMVPWRGYTLVGVWHQVYSGKAEDFTVTEKELDDFVGEINEAYPGLSLKVGDISMWNAGLVLFGENNPDARDLRFAKKSRIVDHAKEHGLQGMITLLGARYSTAKGDAARAIDMVFRKLGRNVPGTRIHRSPIYGGKLECFSEFLRAHSKQYTGPLSEGILKALIRNYGSEYKQVLKFIEEDPSLAEAVGDSDVTKAEIVHAAREEMAQRLADVVFRRTHLGTGEDPGESALQTCAELMAGEHGWDRTRTEEELRDVRNILSRMCIRKRKSMEQSIQR